MKEDDIRDLAIRITDKLVQMGLVPNCIDTDSDAEFEVQDMIFEVLKKEA
tara:strand:+ start:423 stop:572 length:150 start_codon:yes stop_codon:yes gene_type:complete